ncbi:hypothetical protein L6452_28076 [Arctium lappa]|uniref:Uncharacterized protein n=1 Tax=Arctium lappa TaxID=4217 RepID=A0ACB9A1S1_ARCLA|nr:hypothetical protein L6452_28076 [Arctium lappa]
MAAVPQVTGRELSNPPSDGMSNLRFSHHSDHLLVSSWDKSVRLYDASENVLRGEFTHGGVVLDCCFHDDNFGFSASVDNTVRRLVFNYEREDVLGRHDAPVRCIEYSYTTGYSLVTRKSWKQLVALCSEKVACKDIPHLPKKLEKSLCTPGMDPLFWQVITGSWDKTLKCWDPRGASAQERALVETYAQPERVYSLSLVGNRLVVATIGRHVNVYDLRNMSQPEQRRESSLKYQTRCVRCYPNGTGYALSSVEGRVVMEFFDLSDAGQSKNYGTFATGGCDGFVNVWDGNNKKRLYQYSKYPTSIAALSFSRDGRLLVVASSYTFEEGDKPVNEVEVKPKPKVYPNPAS